MRDVIESFAAARQVSTPTLAIETPDQPALEKRLFAAVVNGAPRIHWDCMTGLVGANKAGIEALADLGDSVAQSQMPAVAFDALKSVAELTVIVAHNAHLFFGDAMTIQAISNLRDLFSRKRRTLVLLAPSFKLGPELADVILFEEPRPGEEQRRNILSKLIQKTYDEAFEVKPDWLDATRGLSAFAAEQVFAMSMTKTGIDEDALWERKEKVVNQTRGLKFVRSAHPSFETDLGGLGAFKNFVGRMMDGPKRPGVIVFLDEVEKALAGSSSSGGDSSGVSQDFLLSMLTWMENGNNDGMIAVGLPGTGKTAGGMGIGATHNIPTVVLDPGGLKGSHVGESEQALRDALKVIDSIAGDNGAYVYATCNSEASLPPEFKRRFRDARWFFDLPTREEKDSIWPIHLAAHGLDIPYGKGAVPADTNWTGAEIRNCCELAWRLSLSLKEAAEYIVPVAKADPKTVEALRAKAKGRWLSASTGGAYQGPAEHEESGGARDVQLS